MKKDGIFAKIKRDIVTFPEEHPVATGIMAALGTLGITSIAGWKNCNSILKDERNSHELYFETGRLWGITSITHDILEKGSAKVTINGNDGTSETHVFVERNDNI